MEENKCTVWKWHVGNNGREQKRVFGETRPATARYRHIARKEHRGGKRRAFFVLRHANTLFGKYRDKYRDPKKAKRPRRDHKKTRGAGGVAARRAGPAGGWVTPKKQRARIDMPGWQVLVFPLCIRYVYPMTYPGNKVDKVLDRV